MLSRRMLQVGVALLLIAVALSSVGCKSKAASQQPGGASAVATASVGASGTIDATATTGDGIASKLTSSEASALDAELAAIQRELDKLSVPDDADFSGIESGLK